MLKAELHCHTSEDDKEEIIEYSAKDLIGYLAERGFEVIAITLHDKLMYNEELKEYAEKKGVLLIPGYEPRIQGRDVLVYNVGQEDIEGIKTFEDLYELKKSKPDALIVAAHPYFMKSYCLKELLVKHINLFDAIEYSHFFFPGLNMNKKGERIAKKYNKPMVGTSDVHFLQQLNHTYTLIDSEKNVNAVIDAIKKGKVKVVAKHLPLKVFLKIGFWSMMHTAREVFGIK